MNVLHTQNLIRIAWTRLQKFAGLPSQEASPAIATLPCITVPKSFASVIPNSFLVSVVVIVCHFSFRVFTSLSTTAHPLAQKIRERPLYSRRPLSNPHRLLRARSANP